MATAGKIKSQFKFSPYPGISVPLKLQHASESSAEFVTAQIAGSQARVSDAVGLCRVGSEICAAHKHSGDVAAGAGTKF